MPPLPSVLFVCLGNICRSPLAEAAFRRALSERGLDAEVDSAGTGGWHVGEPPDPRSVETAARHGIDITHYRGRQVKPDDFERYDYIIAMDDQNLANLQALSKGGAKAQLSLLLDHVAGREGQSVADPYYGGSDGFAVTWTDVDAGAQGLLDKILSAPAQS